MKLYIAASSQDRKWIQNIIRLLPEHECHDWPFHEGYMEHIYDPYDIAYNNEEALRECEGLVWMISDHISEGAAQEAFAAHILDIPVVIVDCTCFGISHSRVSACFDAPRVHDIAEAIEVIRDALEAIEGVGV